MYSSDRYKIFNDDILSYLDTYSGINYGSCFCDPPYEIGFMSRKWDRSGIAFSEKMWSGIFRNMAPGTFGMAFSSSRWWYKLVQSLRAVGFLVGFNVNIDSDTGRYSYSNDGIRIPKLIGWIYYTGMPKVIGIDIHLDKRAGVIDQRIISGRYHGTGYTKWCYGVNGQSVPESGYAKYDDNPVTEMAKVWHGHRYSTQALKPTIEPIVIFHKPGIGTEEYTVDTIANILKVAPGIVHRKADQHERNYGLAHKLNSHLAVKPIGLNTALSSVLLPCNNAGSMLIPFSGVMSEAIGALISGWNSIDCVELNTEFVDIGISRAYAWTNITKSGIVLGTDINVN